MSNAANSTVGTQSAGSGVSELARGARGFPYLLINPPLTDPSAPYHALSYLVAPALAAGFGGAVCVDANIEALNYLARPAQVRELLATATRVCAALERKRVLTRVEQLQYRTALLGVGLDPDAVQRAVKTLQDGTDFYNYGRYRTSVDALKRWVQLLAVERAPGMYDPSFEVAQDGIINLGEVDNLASAAVLADVEHGVRPYLDGPFASLIRSREWRLIGISVSYASQLPIALSIARRARTMAPNALILMGGTEVADVVKCITARDRIREVFADVDALVLGEGETAFLAILEALALNIRQREPRRTPIPDRPGIVVPSSMTAKSALPLTTFENLGALPAPRYDIWDWTQYWSPEPVVLYSPTRGCYWNKCTFCDYGLNQDRPTAPSRERPVEQLHADLAQICEFARTVYFAVDAMSPVYIRKMADVLSSPAINLRWAAELRLERNFPKRRLGHQLRESGCVAISFGYESGSQRILDLIDKGVKVAEVPLVLRELREAGIGAQMMGFTGFPSETEAEARETFDFLLGHAEDWTLAGVGDFALTPGSIIAKDADRFGITIDPPSDRAEIRRILGWQSAVGGSRAAAPRAHEVEAAARCIRRFADDRPFVGGIDSAHSLLYFARFGPALIDPHAVDGAAPSSTRYMSRLARLKEFTTREDVRRARERAQFSANRDGNRDYGAWLSEILDAGPPDGSRNLIHVTASGDVLSSLGVDLARTDGPAGKLAQLLLSGTGAA